MKKTLLLSFIFCFLAVSAWAIPPFPPSSSMTYPSGTGVAQVSSGTSWGSTITPGTGVATGLAANVNSTNGFTTYGTDLPLAGGTMSGSILIGSGLGLETDTTAGHSFSLFGYNTGGTSYTALISCYAHATAPYCNLASGTEFNGNVFTALATTAPGTGVVTAIGNNTNATGGLTTYGTDVPLVSNVYTYMGGGEQAVGVIAVASWSNVNYDTLTLSGGNITSGIESTGPKSETATSGSITLISGQNYAIIATLTLTSGQAPTLTGTGGFPTTALSAGANTITWVASGTATVLTLTSTANANFAITFTPAAICNWALGSVCGIAMMNASTAWTLVMSNPVGGQFYYPDFIQNATGGASAAPLPTFSPVLRFWQGNQTPTLSTGASEVDHVTFKYSALPGESGYDARITLHYGSN
jgi:hypothetical protein